MQNKKYSNTKEIKVYIVPHDPTLVNTVNNNLIKNREKKLLNLIILEIMNVHTVGPQYGGMCTFKLSAPFISKFKNTLL